MRGQFSVSFQWLYVLLAGAAFLFIFGMLIRGCAQQGTQDLSAGNLRSLSQTIETLAWQHDTTFNTTVNGVKVACPAEIITLTSGSAQEELRGVPAFLPSRLDGKITLKTIETSIPGPSPLPLGSMAYGIDYGTAYVLIDGADVAMPPGINVFRTSKEPRIPASYERAIVIGTTGVDLRNLDISSLPADLSGVTLGQGIAYFFTRSGDRFVPAGQEPIDDQALALGAALSGDRAIYACARAEYSGRVERLAQLYARRAINLSAQDVEPHCSVLLGQSAATLASSLESKDFLKGFLAHSADLARLQRGLLEGSCPVIA